MRKHAHKLLIAALVAALFVFAMQSCATDTVSKTNAATSVGVGTGVGLVAFASGILTGGWAWAAGVAAGFVSLFFGKSPPPPPPGAVPSSGFPWGWVVLVFAAWMFLKLLASPRYREWIGRFLARLLTLRLPTAASSLWKASGAGHSRSH